MKIGARQNLKIMAIASTMGLSMVLATMMGFGFGYYLDNWVFDTAPWLTFIFLILGIIAGFRNLLIIARMIKRMEDDAKSGKL